MESKTYNKLVRDLIPEWLKTKGIRSKTKIVSGQEKLGLLFDKFHEEFLEFKNAKNNNERKSELGDILEVVKGIASHFEYPWDEIEIIANNKKQERGGFENGVFLIETTKE
ncbi:MAG: nucleoside triphosphate pyrophosphohydrolase [Candidatus Pacebacteria bacterium]|nr:nucleoside triphosphate pyrophosphohydrolase [Candidatus Paceibacterota bacterium]